MKAGATACFTSSDGGYAPRVRPGDANDVAALVRVSASEQQQHRMEQSKSSVVPRRNSKAKARRPVWPSRFRTADDKGGYGA